MPTTTNLSAEDPASVDPQAQEGSPQDNLQAAQGSSQSTASTEDATQGTASASDMSQLIGLTSVTGSEVSSTVEDTDPSEKYESGGDLSAVEPATSTTNNLFHDNSNPPSDDDPRVLPPPPPASKGFQDAFAAFASATLPEPDEEEEMEVQESNVAESDAGEVNSSETMPSDFILSAEKESSPAPNVADVTETQVSSAIDSSFVSTTKDLIAADQPQESLPASESLQQFPEEQQAISQADQQLYQMPSEQLVDPNNQDLIQNQAVVDTDNQEQLIQQGTDSENSVPNQMELATEQTEQQAQEASAVSDSVYFIQGTDATGEVVTSIIDPNDIGSYLDSVVYKQCMMANGEIETTIVHSGVQPAAQEQQQQQPQEEQQVIYAHDLNGQLTPIDSTQSANDVAPPGKQFVYMQDSTGRIIRTIMDANQTMVPGQQVYYTQSDDGRIITSVMDPTSAAEDQQQQGDQTAYHQQQQTFDQTQQQQQPTFDLTQQQQQQTYDLTQQQQDIAMDSAAMAGIQQQQPENVGEAANFNIDSGLSGLNMLAELSHLTAGQTPTASGLPTEHKGTSSTDSNSADMDEFRPVAMITRRIGIDEGVDEVSSTISGLKVGQQESPVGKLVSELKPELQLPALTVSRDNLFVQWQNLDAMCWMDVVLIMLVYSPTLRPLVNLDPGHELASTLLITLLKANRQAQVLVQNLLKKSNGAEVSGLQTGAGNAATSIQDPKTAKLVCKENMDEIGKAINILYAMREKIWQALQPRLRCERGKHNSPVLVLPLLVREKPAIKQMFTMNYRYVFKCEKCGYTQDDVHTKILPSIPAVPEDFNMREPCFVRNCFECQAPNQRMMMKFEGLQDFVQMHFVKGLPHNRFDELSFDFQGDHYEVTAVVHYKNNPDHFIAWVRNAPGSTWMECDDLKSVITRYHHTMPAIPPSQVHMVMWERRLTPAHQLQMRDTEDTKVLASLVLTVQQPSTHNTSDPAARPTGLPSTNSSLPGSGKASSLLSGVTGQSPVFSPYIPRGRGRGSRGRGSRGARGAISAATTPTIRRSTPINLTGSTSANQTGSPQVVRLPLSALSNSSGGSLGASGTPSTTKYVLMGNSGSGQGSGGTASKVVVVRSQGGANNLTAQQLLQLLQRTGAITQSGAKIAIASSGANTTAVITSTVTTNTSTLVSSASNGSASYIIQSDGTIMTTSAPVSTVTQSIQSSLQLSSSSADTGSTAVSMDTTDSASTINSGESKPSVKLVSVLPSALASLTSAYGGVNTSNVFREQLSAQSCPQMEGSAQMLLDQSSSSQVPQMDASSGMDPTCSSQETSEGSIVPQISEEGGESLSSANIQQTSETNPVLVSPETTGPSTIASSSSTPQQQQGSASRYIQIPTSGGGSLLTQLIVKNGKMVLVPVDKATQAQAQAQPSSVLKLSGGALGSTPKITLRTATSGSSQILSGSASQLQQQQVDGATSPSSISSSAASSLNLSNLVSKGNQRFITVPSTQGSTPKRTIQLISVPRGPGQPNTKTIILNPGSASNSAGNATQQLSLPAETPATTATGDDQTGDSEGQGRILSQEGNIVIRELRRPEASPATLTTTLMGDADSSLISTPAVSLLRDMSSRSSTQGGLSLIGAGQKQPESFKYILPGSNTTHVLHTGSSVGTSQVTSRAFTALSSSGTIIGGQLTPAVGSSTMGTSPMDQDLGLSDSEEGTGVFGLDNTEFIPHSRGRARGGRGSRGGKVGRGSQRGRGRGSRSGGRGRASSELWSTMEMVAPGSSQNISALSGLRQVGAHVIESGAENVDGVPVLSIPEFSDASQTEASSAAESIQEEAHTLPGPEGMQSQADQQPLEAWASPDGSVATPTNPRVITQSIPSVKANHGFDILTQGILGSEASGPPQTYKKARSLLTGAQVTTATAFPEPHESTDSSFSVPAATSMQAEETNLQGGSSAQPQHSEIDTLIEAALAAAKPSKAKATEDDSNETGKSLFDQEFEASSEPGKHDQRVVSVEERHVSAAERYRMPMELFQPDDESLERPAKSDIWSTKILETDEQPGSLGQAQTGERPEEWIETQADEQGEALNDAQQMQKEQGVGVVEEDSLDTEKPFSGKDVAEAIETAAPGASSPLPATNTIASPQLSSPPTSPGRLSSRRRTSSPTKSPRRRLSSVSKDESSQAVQKSESIPLFPMQAHTGSTDFVELEQPAPVDDNDQSMTEVDPESHNEEQVQTPSEANIPEATQKISSKPKGRKRARSRGKPGRRKSSTPSANADSSAAAEADQVSHDPDALAHQEGAISSDVPVKDNGYPVESDVRCQQDNAENFGDVVPETDNGDIYQADDSNSVLSQSHEEQSVEKVPTVDNNEDCGKDIFKETDDLTSTVGQKSPTSKLLEFSPDSTSMGEADMETQVLGDSSCKENVGEEYVNTEVKQTTCSGLDNDTLIDKEKDIDALERSNKVEKDEVRGSGLVESEGLISGVVEESEEDFCKIQKAVKKHVEQKQSLLSGAGGASDLRQRKKQKADQTVLLRSRRQISDWTKPLIREGEESYFNYDVLVGSRQSKRSKRHPSLDSSRPISRPHKKEKEGPPGAELLQAKVIRRHEKPLQRPEVDPARDPTLVPLVMEGDEGCTGGSVVTSPTDTEVFTGVVIGHKRQQADWACGSSLEEETDEEEHSSLWDATWSPEELRLAQAQYCHQLTMVLFMQAGDVSFLLSGDNESEADDGISDNSVKGSDDLQDAKDVDSVLLDVKEQDLDEEVEMEEDVGISGEKQFAQLEVLESGDNQSMPTDPTSLVKIGQKRGRKKKRGLKSPPMSPSLATPTNTPPTKRQRLSQDEDHEVITCPGENDEQRQQGNKNEEHPEAISESKYDDSANTNVNLTATPSSTTDDGVALSSPAPSTEIKRKRGRPKKNTAQAPSLLVNPEVLSDLPPSKGLGIPGEIKELQEDTEMSDRSKDGDVMTAGQTNGLSSPIASEDPVFEGSNTNTHPLSTVASPSRRSGRMTIPSKKVLDSWEDAPLSQRSDS